MTELEVFLSLAAAHAIAVVSPGPDFTIMVRQSLAYGRNTALWSALGIGSGILVHVFYSIVGLGIVIATNEIIFNIFKYAGAAYLLFLAYQGWQASKTPREDQAIENKTVAKIKIPKPSKAYRDGLLTNALNVKASMFFLALFLLVTYDSSLVLQIFYGCYLAVATAIYFCLLAWFFSRFHPFFQRYIAAVEKGTAILLALIAVVLILFTGQPEFNQR